MEEKSPLRSPWADASVSMPSVTKKSRSAAFVANPYGSSFLVVEVSVVAVV